MKTIPKIDLSGYKILSPLEMNSIHFSSDKHSDRPMQNASADSVPGAQSGNKSPTHKKLSDL